MTSRNAVHLSFDPPSASAKPPATQLSAAVRIGDTLIVAADEGGDLEVLGESRNRWAQIARVSLHDIMTLPAGREIEVDIEGLAVEDDWLWVVGSHSLKRRKPQGSSAERALSSMRTLVREANRYLLARIPLERQKSGHMRPVKKNGERRTAMVEVGKRSSMLVSWLAEDPLLAPFTGIASKENGLDIEGIAVSDNDVWLGLRGPVLRGHAVVLRLDIRANKRDLLKAKKTDGTRRFRKYLLPLDGLGIRDIELDGRDLLLLTGPTMSGDGPSKLVRWRNALDSRGSSVIPKSQVSTVRDLSDELTKEAPESICHWTTGTLLLLHDRPSPRRLSDNDNAFVADLLVL
ncbi:MAG: DUF3616 domain-containing protein [Paracoccaceae bacterium]|mgnify:CR=1 FL=1